MLVATLAFPLLIFTVGIDVYLTYLAQATLLCRQAMNAASQCMVQRTSLHIESPRILPILKHVQAT